MLYTLTLVENLGTIFDTGLQCHLAHVFDLVERRLNPFLLTNDFKTQQKQEHFKQTAAHTIKHETPKTRQFWREQARTRP